MKHLSILFALFVAFYGQATAQDVTFLYNGAPYGEQDTIECSLPHGVMIEMDGFGVTNNSGREANLYYIAEFADGNADISVGGICIAGGQCTSGNVSAPFTVGGNSSYNDIALEMMVPDEVANGDYAIFRIKVVDASLPDRKDGVPYTWLRVRCNTNGILTAQTLPLHVYPNPTTDRLVIEAGSWVSGTLNVYNTLGQLVHQQPVEATACTVDTKQWAAGVYHCQVVSDGKIAATASVVKE